MEMHFMGGMTERLNTIIHLAHITKGIGSALDIGAGKGSSSFYLANKGFHVDAVDIRNREEFQRENRFDHQSIIKYHQRIEDFKCIKNYSIMLITNVIMFLEREYVIHELLPSLVKHISESGIICIAFLETDNDETRQKLSHQNWFIEHEIIDALVGCSIINSEVTNTITKTHPKHGEVEFYSKILTFQKNKA